MVSIARDNISSDPKGHCPFTRLVPTERPWSTCWGRHSRLGLRLWLVSTVARENISSPVWWSKIFSFRPARDHSNCAGVQILRSIMKPLNQPAFHESFIHNQIIMVVFLNTWRKSITSFHPPLPRASSWQLKWLSKNVDQPFLISSWQLTWLTWLTLLTAVNMDIGFKTAIDGNDARTDIKAQVSGEEENMLTLTSVNAESLSC